jgi:hypothetical protein
MCKELWSCFNLGMNLSNPRRISARWILERDLKIATREECQKITLLNVALTALILWAFVGVIVEFYENSDRIFPQSLPKDQSRTPGGRVADRESHLHLILNQSHNDYNLR